MKLVLIVLCLMCVSAESSFASSQNSLQNNSKAVTCYLGGQSNVIGSDTMYERNLWTKTFTPSGVERHLILLDSNVYSASEIPATAVAVGSDVSKLEGRMIAEIKRQDKGEFSFYVFEVRAGANNDGKQVRIISASIGSLSAEYPNAGLILDIAGNPNTAFALGCGIAP